MKIPGYRHLVNFVLPDLNNFKADINFALSFVPVITGLTFEGVFDGVIHYKYPDGTIKEVQDLLPARIDDWVLREVYLITLASYITSKYPPFRSMFKLSSGLDCCVSGWEPNTKYKSAAVVFKIEGSEVETKFVYRDIINVLSFLDNLSYNCLNRIINIENTGI